jgi:hypothetical protein
LDLSAGRRPSALRLIFWLKWKLTLRGYQRSSTAAVGALIGIFLILPAMGAVGFVSYLGFVNMPPPYPQHLLRAALLGIYFFWILSPLMGFAVNETFDVTKLFVYPISIRQLLLGSIAGSLVDFPVLFLMPVLFAAFLGFAGGGEGAILTATTLVLFLAHTLALGQSIVLATSGILRSRRYRDLLMVLVPLVWIVYYVVSEMMRRGSIEVDWHRVLDSPYWEAASYLPPGMAARAVVAANQGEPLTALGWCAVLAGLTAATVWLAAFVIQRVYAGETESGKGRSKTSGPGGDRSGGKLEVLTEPRPLGLKLSPAAQAVYTKELRYMARDPSYKAAFMNLLYTLVIAVFMVIPRQGRNLPGSIMVWPASMIVLMSEVRFFFNIFGTEGAAAPLFFLFPAPRRDILVGKVIAYFLVATVLNVALAAALCAISGTIAELPYILFWMVAATLFFLAIGGVLSVVAPLQVVARGRKVRQASAGQGCALGFLYMAVSLGSFIALAPVLAAVFVPRLWVPRPWLFATLPLALAYVAGAAYISLNISERMLMRRELDLTRKLAGEE